MTTKTLSPTIPPELWRKSPRPGASMTLRLGLAGGFALAGLIAPTPAIKGVCLGLAVLSFIIVPVLGDRLLRPIEVEVEKANRSDARKLLRDLTERWAVRWFAPSAWVSVQQARLQLSSGDPRAAAMSFFEARRASALGGQRPELTSAEADAHLHADDRKQALKLLRELEDKKSLAALDHLNFGVALLSESGHNEAALAHFEAAYETLGKEPRVVAGLALARQRCGDLEGARELLDGELDLDDSEDRTARDLAKRARKGLRAKGEDDKKGKGKRKKGKDKKGQKPVRESEQAEPEQAEPVAKEATPAKSSKKDRKKDKPKGKKARRAARREARKQREAEERAARAAAREREELEAVEARRQASERAAAKAKRASEVRTLPAVPAAELAQPAAPARTPAFSPKPPAAASGSIATPKVAAPAPKSPSTSAPAAQPAPPKADSLFGGMFAPPKLGGAAKAPAPPSSFAKPPAPAAAVTPKPSTAKPSIPAASKLSPPTMTSPVAAKAAPSLDDLFAPVPSAPGSAPKIPAPPAIGAPPVVPPPPVSAPSAVKAPSVTPPNLDDWGSSLDLPVLPPVVAPVPNKTKRDD